MVMAPERDTPWKQWIRIAPTLTQRQVACMRSEICDCKGGTAPAPAVVASSYKTVRLGQVRTHTHTRTVAFVTALVNPLKRLIKILSHVVVHTVTDVQSLCGERNIDRHTRHAKSRSARIVSHALHGAFELACWLAAGCLGRSLKYTAQVVVAAAQR